jgi:dTDP-4-amino-4,6-dideoxygalactose transaminase
MKTILKAIKRVLISGQFVLGKEVEALEKEVADYCKVKYAIGVNSGTDALLLSLKSLNIGQGDEVITSPFTFIATAEAIVNAGTKPVFVDIRDDKNINPDLIEITNKTEAILPVHLFGRELDEKVYQIAKRYNLWVIEDMAQAFGNRLRGDVGCLSFYPTKILGACGDAGMVITNKKWIANKVRLLRNHGSSKKDKYLHSIIGFNSRLDEIQAAILREKLKHLPENFKYDETKYYPIPLHLQPCFRYLGYKKGDFPMAEKMANKVKFYVSKR